MEQSKIALPIGVTLDRFVNNLVDLDAHFVSGLSQLLRDIALASKVINREINKAGLVDIMGNYGQQNKAGDEQQKLDILADIRFTRALFKGGEVGGLISEEIDGVIDFKNDGKYIVAIDPLDGSSNIDVNVPVGTIFSIYKRISKSGAPLQTYDYLQKGDKQVVAGYILYGSSTMLVLTAGNGVHGFTYEVGLGEYFLSHPNITIPEDGNIYSINEGMSNHFVDESIIAFIANCKKKNFNARYIGSMVADFHRNLLKGGIYLYPSSKAYPNGKLRLLYECNPLAFIVEQAGGKASNGKGRILDIEPENEHHRTPLFIGSKNLVESLIG